VPALHPERIDLDAERMLDLAIARLGSRDHETTKSRPAGPPVITSPDTHDPKGSAIAYLNQSCHLISRVAFACHASHLASRGACQRECFRLGSTR